MIEHLSRWLPIHEQMETHAHTQAHSEQKNRTPVIFLEGRCLAIRRAQKVKPTVVIERYHRGWKYPKSQARTSTQTHILRGRIELLWLRRHPDPEKQNQKWRSRAFQWLEDLTWGAHNILDSTQPIKIKKLKVVVELLSHWRPMDDSHNLVPKPRKPHTLSRRIELLSPPWQGGILPLDELRYRNRVQLHLGDHSGSVVDFTASLL